MVDIREENGKIIVKPGINIVAGVVKDIKAEISALVNDGKTDIIIDLEGVEMIDSMGLGVLIATHNSIQEHDKKLELINIPSDIGKLLRTMRLDQHFNM